MTVQIIQDFIPSGRRNRPGYKLTPKYITIHDTANTQAGADARAHAQYLKGSTAASLPVSWHFTVDDKAIYQHLPLNENGWHAGDGTNGTGNRQSIGIEICENRDGNRAQAEKNAAWLAAKLLKDYGLGLDRVKQHYDWSGKNCPRVLRGRKDGWKNFLAAVEAHLISAELPNIVKTVGIKIKHKDVGLVGYYSTRPSGTLGFLTEVFERLGGKVTGHGDYINIDPPKAADPAQVQQLQAEVAALKAENASLKSKIDTARKALS